MSHQSDTSSWFLANQSFLFLLNVVCLGETQEIWIVIVIKMFDPIWTRTNDLRYSRRARLPLHHLLGRDDNCLTFCKGYNSRTFCFIEIYKWVFFVQKTWHLVLPNMANTIVNGQPGFCFIIEQLSIYMTSFIEPLETCKTSLRVEPLKPTQEPNPLYLWLEEIEFFRKKEHWWYKSSTPFFG